MEEIDKINKPFISSWVDLIEKFNKEPNLYAGTIFRTVANLKFWPYPNSENISIEDAFNILSIQLIEDGNCSLIMGEINHFIKLYGFQKPLTFKVETIEESKYSNTYPFKKLKEFSKQINIPIITAIQQPTAHEETIPIQVTNLEYTPHYYTPTPVRTTDVEMMEYGWHDENIEQAIRYLHNTENLNREEALIRYFATQLANQTVGYPAPSRMDVD